MTTYVCINCNAPRVRRDGDVFTCEKCAYEWDVAHEQQNAVYVSSQRRAPVSGAEDSPDASAPQTLMQQLGIEPVKEPAPVEPVSASEDAVLTDPRYEDDDDALDDVRELPVETQSVVESDALTAWLDSHYTISDLETLAEDHGVDLSGTSRKADIVQRVIDADVLTVIYTTDGAILDVE